MRALVWPFARGRRAEIAAHFAEQQRARPNIWNGRVLLGRDAVFTDGHSAPTYFETDFASFLAWRDWGFLDRGRVQRLRHGRAAHLRWRLRHGRDGTCTPPMRDASISQQARPIPTMSGTARSIFPAASSRELEEETGLIAGRLPGRGALALCRHRRGDRDDPASSTWICPVRLRARGSKPILPAQDEPEFRPSISCAGWTISRRHAAICHGLYRAAVRLRADARRA